MKLTTTSFRISVGFAIKNTFKHYLYDAARNCNVNIEINKISGVIKINYNVNIIGEPDNIIKFFNIIEKGLIELSKKNDDDIIIF